MSHQTIFDFDEILGEAKVFYNTLKPGPDCPPDEMLLDYVYDDLTEEEFISVSEHIRKCEYCMMEVLKMEADQTEWEYMLNENPDKAIADIFGASAWKSLGQKKAVIPADTPILSKLEEWFGNLFQENNWQPAELLLTGACRGAAVAEETSWSIRRAKVIEVAENPLLLLVQLTPQEGEDVEVSLQVYPSGGAFYLPQGLQIRVIDQTGEVLMDDESDMRNDGMKLTWIRESGEQFGFTVTLGDVTIKESLS